MIQIQRPVLTSIALWHMLVRYAEGKTLSGATFLLLFIRNFIPMLVRLQRLHISYRSLIQNRDDCAYFQSDIRPFQWAQCSCNRNSELTFRRRNMTWNDRKSQRGHNSHVYRYFIGRLQTTNQARINVLLEVTRTVSTSE